MTSKIKHLEERRSRIQRERDEVKARAERNRLGQFATPVLLAKQMLQFAKKRMRPEEPVRFLDPAFGTGVFFSALISVFGERRVQRAVGFEIDDHYGQPARELWGETKLRLRTEDFTACVPPGNDDKYNLIVCNPPYVRHHHLSSEQKTRLRDISRTASGGRLSGLAGLYCYFLLFANSWAEHNGICIWLVPSEFMDVNYGKAIKEYLLNEVTLIRIHRFDPKEVQFDDALVSSSVVCFRNSPPPENSEFEFTFGGDLIKPTVTERLLTADLKTDQKWKRQRSRTYHAASLIRLADLFDVKRGLATGDNKFFIITPDRAAELRLPKSFLRPILPSPRYLRDDEVGTDANGNPSIERLLLLLDCPLPQAIVKEKYPELWEYFESGRDDVAAGYLCRSRSPWYAQENRPAPPFLCTYMGRGNGATSGSPFRFILNHSRATAANVYLLLYPKLELRRALAAQPELTRKIWLHLKSVSPDTFFDQGRVYGGGLYKLEPRELGNVPANEIAELAGLSTPKRSVQLGMFSPQPEPPRARA
ncbi:MAG TPA: class I SAM-dependent methyltransferase [Candidatus Acidoferrales bacterium]|nr:class I SAM-dependent methyltransferase [Candidatus Acidoferrales bacterium]